MSADPNDRTATLAPRTSTPDISDAPDARSPDAPDGPNADDSELLPVDDPDRYEQISEHARGGLGRIVRAVDRRLGRTVAVKELLRRDDWHEARFVREALITARLEHPGIVPVHEAGRWPNGDPYYVMKLVEGRTLKELMAGHTQLRERLGLLQHVIAVADAVGYAHSEGVIHRDVKPSNVIVGSFGETIVVDWGLARDCKHDVPEPAAELLAAGSGSVSTISGKVIGTPAYMAPEQARGEVVDARADVYAIGAVLYELLAGKSPHADETPEATLDRVIAGPPAPICRVSPTVPTELADIVAKAMARAPHERYANATLLAEDLRRFQTGKLVSAHAYTAWQLVRKKLAQHRGVVAVALASAVALGAVGVESFHKVVAERDIAQRETTHAETAARSAEEKGRELVLLQAQTSLRKDPTAALAWLKKVPITDRDLEQIVDVIDEATAMGAARYVFRPNQWVVDAAFMPDGRSVVAIVRDGIVRRYDLATGAETQLGTTPSDPEALAISPDGRWAVTGGIMGDVVAWSLDGGKPMRLVERGRVVTALRFDDAGQRLLVERDGHAELLGLDGDVTKVGPASAQHVAVASHDWSKRAGLVAPNQVAVITDAGTRVVAQTDRAIRYLALSPPGDTIYLHDGHTLWSVPFAGGTLTKVAPFEGELVNIAWTVDCRTAAVFGKIPDITMLDTSVHTARELRGHTDSIYSAEFTRDGHGLLTASDDGTARVWNLADGSSVALRGHDDDVYRARLSPDERFAVTSSLDGSLRVWPIANSDARVLFEGAPIQELELAGDRAQVQTSAALAAWNIETGTREALVSWQQGLGVGVPSPDGNHLLALGPGWTMELRARDGKAPMVLRGHKALISHMEWSHDSKIAYSSSYDGTLRRWDLETGTSEMLVEGDVPVRGFAVAADGRVSAQVGDASMMIYPDGRAETLGTGPKWCAVMAQFDKVRDRLLFQRCDHTLGIYDHGVMTELPTDGIAIVRLAVSPDGERIAGAIGDRTIRIWDMRGHVLAVLRGHDDLVLDVAFSPDGTELASASYDKTIRIWQLATGRHRVLRGHSGAVNRVAWRGAGQLVTASLDGTLRVWPVPGTELPSQADVTRRLELATTATIDDRNRATTHGS
jgi:WD40 repeat protein